MRVGCSSRRSASRTQPRARDSTKVTSCLPGRAVDASRSAEAARPRGGESELGLASDFAEASANEASGGRTDRQLDESQQHRASPTALRPVGPGPKPDIGTLHPRGRHREERTGGVQPRVSLIDVEFKLAPRPTEHWPRPEVCSPQAPRLARRARRCRSGLGPGLESGPASSAYSSLPSHARCDPFGGRELDGHRAVPAFPRFRLRAGPPMRGRALDVSAPTERGCAECQPPTQSAGRDARFGLGGDPITPGLSSDPQVGNAAMNPRKKAFVPSLPGAPPGSSSCSTKSSASASAKPSTSPALSRSYIRRTVAE